MFSVIHCVSVVFSGENIICMIHNNQRCHAPAPAPGPAALPRMYSARVVRTWSVPTPSHSPMLPPTKERTVLRL